MTTIADLEQMPDGVSFGRVTGNVSQFVGDVAFDSDTLPDRLPMQCKISFTPNVAYVIVEATGDLIFQTTITADVQSDGSFVIDLVATDSPGLNPPRWAYDVRIDPVGSPGLKTRIAVPGGTTQTLGSLIGAAQPGVAVARVQGPPGPAPVITWDGTTIIVDGVRGPDLDGGTGMSGDQIASVVSAYDASMSTSPLTGTRTVQVPGAGATYAIDLASDATLTLDAADGATVALDVAAHGHTLTITDGPTISADGLCAMVHSRGVWRSSTPGAATSAPTSGPTPVPEPKDTTAPTLTGTVTVGTIGADRVQLTLSQRAVDAHDGDALTYQASVDAGKTWAACSDSGTTLTLTGLTPETTYPAPRVRALDAAGNISTVLTSAKGFKTTVKMGVLDTYALSKNPLYYFPGDQGKATYFGRGVWYSGETPNGEFVKGTWDGPAIGTLDTSWHLDATRAGRGLGYMTSLGSATQASAALTIQVAAFPATYSARDVFGMAATLLGYDLKFWSEDGTTIKGSWGDYELPNAVSWLGATHTIGIDWTKGGTVSHYVDGDMVFAFTAHSDLERGTFVGEARYVVNAGGLFMDDALLGDDGHRTYAQSALGA